MVSQKIDDGNALSSAQIDWLIEHLPQAKETLSGHGNDIWLFCLRWRINPLLLFAISRHESHFGTDYKNNPNSSFGKGKNMAGLDAPSNWRLFAECGTPAVSTLKVFSGASWHTIAIFSEWWHSMNAQAWLLRTNYIDKGLTNVLDILHKYSPHIDNNNPDAYAVDVTTYMKKYADMIPETVFPTPVPIPIPITIPIPIPKENVMPTVEAVLAEAQKDVGIHESPMGSNKTPIGVWFGFNGVAWCAEAVSHWLILAGFNIRKNAGAHELAYELVNDYNWKKIAPKDLQRGDVWLAAWSHIGIVKYRIDGDHYKTIEGNQDNGVHEVTRHNSECDYGVRPPYSKIVLPPKPSVQPFAAGEIHRLQYKGDYLYTASAEEATKAVSSGWFHEGPAFNVLGGTIPVRRLRHDSKGTHFYTASQVERDTLVGPGKAWSDEGVAFYGMEAGNECRRYLHTPTGRHIWTASVEESANCVKLGWTFEGVGWFVI